MRSFICTFKCRLIVSSFSFFSAGATTGKNDAAERKRIEKEIEKFEIKYGGKATVIEGGEENNQGGEETSSSAVVETLENSEERKEVGDDETKEHVVVGIVVKEKVVDTKVVDTKVVDKKVAKNEDKEEMGGEVGVLAPPESVDGMWAQSVQFETSDVVGVVPSAPKAPPAAAAAAAAAASPPPAPTSSFTALLKTNVHHQRLVADFGLDELE